MLRLPLLTSLGLLLAASPSLARTWHITPDGTGDAPTIQAGIDAASSGDVVLVSAGTYFENLTMKSGVTLESESGAVATTIDGSAAGSVIDCVGVSTSTTIRGFTLTNGTGTLEFNGRYGGAIRCWQGASPVIEENILVGNSATFGGGIGCRYGSVPHIRDNEIRENTALGVTFGEGGGIFAIDGFGGSVTIHANEIRDNMAKAGGGIWVGGIDAVISRNLVVGNSAQLGGATWAAGGIWSGFAGNRTISWNIVAANTSVDIGGGMWVNEGTNTIENNTFHGNAAPIGGAIATGGRGTKYIRRNILAASPQGLGIDCTETFGDTFLECNDIWGNADGDGLCGVDGGNNFSADPLFCDPDAGDYHLQWASPCLPANSPEGCGLIGAFGFGGCSSVGVVPDTWARVKARYR